MTQLVRIEPGNTVEEAHMRNRQLICLLYTSGHDKGYYSEISLPDAAEYGWICPGGSNEQDAGAVSYTHLDVYKRQP